MAVQFDASSAGGSSFNHTVSADANYLFVQTFQDTTAVTYNGVSMTELSNYHPTFGTFAANCPYVVVWGLENPATGTNSVSLTGGTQGIASSYKNVLSVTHGADSASVGGQTSTWESTVTLGTNDWGLAFFAGANNFARTLQAYTNSTLRVTNDRGEPNSIMDSNGHQTPGSYSLWAQWSSGSGFVTASTFILSTTITTITKSETVPIFDYIAKVPSKILVETVSLIETVSKVPARLLNEAVSLFDTIDNIKGTWYQVAYTETIAITDSIVNSFVFFITAVENLTITDAVLDFAKKLRGLLRGKNNNTNIKTGVRRT